jgi:Fusaric acid resistance protein-like
MPLAYWAAIATLVVIQSSLGATLTLSIERIIATTVGASVAAVEANYFGANLVAFMVAIVIIGLLSYGFRLERTAYRYASVTLAIIVLIPRSNPAWICCSASIHRGFSRNRCRASRSSLMAGTVSDCRQERGSIIRFSGKPPRWSCQSTL